MTVDEVRAKVAEIASLSEIDLEAAHSEEDRLHQSVLRELAEREPLAAEALKTTEREYPRHCA